MPFTSGPYTIEDKDGDVIPIVSASTRTEICAVGSVNPDDQEDNALLLAAAPEQHAALLDCITDEGKIAVFTKDLALKRLAEINAIAAKAVRLATGIPREPGESF